MDPVRTKKHQLLGRIKVSMVLKQVHESLRYFKYQHFVLSTVGMKKIWIGGIASQHLKRWHPKRKVTELPTFNFQRLCVDFREGSTKNSLKKKPLEDSLPVCGLTNLPREDNPCAALFAVLTVLFLSQTLQTGSAQPWNRWFISQFFPTKQRIFHGGCQLGFKRTPCINTE